MTEAESFQSHFLIARNNWLYVFSVITFRVSSWGLRAGGKLGDRGVVENAEEEGVVMAEVILLEEGMVEDGVIEEEEKEEEEEGEEEDGEEEEEGT